MTLRLAEKFDILRRSPHDASPSPEPESKDTALEVVSWVPSRYNVRAKTTDGKLVLWNTYHATLTVFQPEQREAIEALLSPKGFDAREEGAVEYLARRGYLLPAGTNEFLRFQLAFGQQHYRSDHLRLILLSSEDCNFRCTYCYEKFAHGTMLPWVRSGIKNLVRERLPGLRSLSVSWFGGEPLYGLEAIEDLAPFFRQISDEHSLTFLSDVTTNGYLLIPGVAGQLLKWGIRRYQITIDGPPESHDQSRPARDGSGTFRTILANLRDLKKRPDDFKMNLRVNFDKNNCGQMAKFFDIVETDFGGDPRFQLRFRPVGRWGGENDDQLAVCGKKERTDVYLQLKKEAARRGLTLAEDEDLRKIRGMKSPGVCYAARPFNFIIGATGKIMKCTVDLDYEDRNVVGKITESGELELDKDKFAAWTEPAFESDSKCKKCVVLPLCNGLSCPLRRIRTRESPCIPLRSTLKRELRAAADISSSGERKVSVGPLTKACARTSRHKAARHKAATEVPSSVVA